MTNAQIDALVELAKDLSRRINLWRERETTWGDDQRDFCQGVAAGYTDARNDLLRLIGDLDKLT